MLFHCHLFDEALKCKRMIWKYMQSQVKSSRNDEWKMFLKCGVYFLKSKYFFPSFSKMPGMQKYLFTFFSEFVYFFVTTFVRFCWPFTRQIIHESEFPTVRKKYYRSGKQITFFEMNGLKISRTNIWRVIKASGTAKRNFRVHWQVKCLFIH